MAWSSVGILIWWTMIPGCNEKGSLVRKRAWPLVEILAGSREGCTRMTSCHPPLCVIGWTIGCNVWMKSKRNWLQLFLGQEVVAYPWTQRVNVHKTGSDWTIVGDSWHLFYKPPLLATGFRFQYCCIWTSVTWSEISPWVKSEFAL